LKTLRVLLPGSPGRILLAATAFLVAAMLALPALAAPTFPKLTGRVVDDANLLSPAAEQQLTRKLEALEASTGRQVVVATLPSLQGLEIEEYGYQLGRAWGIGTEKNDDGAVLIVAPAERKVRVEVGYGLEPVLTDALSSVIIQQVILPKFKAGDMEGGVVAGADALIQQLSLPEDQARANVAQAADTSRERGGGMPPWPFLIIIVIFFVIIPLLRGGRRRRRGGGLGDVVTGAVLGSIFSNHDDWGGGGGGWGGGGGFSGGGGSFGGGGASGGW
jgi:uncharacterized protein